jgi:hypothetical protein
MVTDVHAPASNTVLKSSVTTSVKKLDEVKQHSNVVPHHTPLNNPSAVNIVIAGLLLKSSGLSRSVRWFHTDVSGLYAGPIQLRTVRPGILLGLLGL